jgi:hypothetical protein
MAFGFYSVNVIPEIELVFVPVKRPAQAFQSSY